MSTLACLPSPLDDDMTPGMEARLRRETAAVVTPIWRRQRWSIPEDARGPMSVDAAVAAANACRARGVACVVREYTGTVEWGQVLVGGARLVAVRR